MLSLREDYTQQNGFGQRYTLQHMLSAALIAIDNQNYIQIFQMSQVFFLL